MKKTRKIILILLAIILLAMIIFCSYELVTLHKKYYISEKKLPISIFTYHEIVENKKEIKEDYMQTSIKTFEKQITGLTKLGYRPINYQDLKDYYDGNKPIYKRSFLITFDDGYESFYKYVYPIAKKYNIPVTVFVIDDCIDGENYLSWEQIKEMYKSGLISIYSHGLHHSQYNLIPAEQLVQETNDAYTHLQEEIGDKNLLKVFAYPYGLYTEDEISKMAKAGYIQNLMDSRVNHSNILNLNRLHRVYPKNDSALKIMLKQEYRDTKYKN